MLGAQFVMEIRLAMNKKKILIWSQAGTFFSWILFGSAYFFNQEYLGITFFPLFIIGLSRITDGITGGNASVANAYLADITFGTNNEFGFDYLRDNMSSDVDALVQRKHHYAIIDEVDSVLIDDARTPLIISGPTPKGDIHEFHELKPRVEKLMSAQKKYVQNALIDAKKMLAPAIDGAKLTKDAEEKGAVLTTINPANEDLSSGRKLAPVLAQNVTADMVIAEEEIFGPILPIIGYDNIDNAMAHVNDRPRPLALYYFGYNKSEQDYVLDNTHSGGVSVNDTLMHLAQEDMHFGGVGDSGMGHYHGKEGFITFSKAKAVHRKGRISAGSLAYPPYDNSIRKMIYTFFIR